MISSIPSIVAEQCQIRRIVFHPGNIVSWRDLLKENISQLVVRLYLWKLTYIAPKDARTIRQVHVAIVVFLTLKEICF
jgi:hypothetical protein